MISRLEIRGFKSLVDTTIDLGAVNIFIGANGSGKSNLLEAVGFLSAIISGGLETETIRYRGVRPGTPISFCSSLVNRSTRTISLSAQNEQTFYSADVTPDDENPSRWSILTESARFNGFEVLRRTPAGLEILIDDQFTSIPLGNPSPSKSVVQFWGIFAYSKVGFNPLELSKNVPIKNASNSFFSFLTNYGIFSPSTPQLRGFLDDIQRDPLGLNGSGLSQAIDDMMKGSSDALGPFDIDEVFDLIDWADSLRISPDLGTESVSLGGPQRLRIGDRFMGEGHKSVSLLESSEGALYVLFMLALIGHSQSPKFFAVDNFDQALHPRLACALTRLVSEQILREDERQMLATTHNPLVLDGLDLLDDRIRLFAVDRDLDGATKIDRVVVTEELMSQAESGLSLSRLWLMGRLGGVPKYL